jgi:hypothetical protein
MRNGIKTLEVVKVGSEFGNLTVERLERELTRGGKVWFAYCRRTDGELKKVRARKLATGHTSGMIEKRKFYNGLTREHGSEYQSYNHMMDRCYNESHPHYKSYGGRGIKVCDRWRESFQSFLEDMGNRPDGTSLDRRDGDGDYSPENCKWATQVEQNNNRRNNLMLTIYEKTMTAGQWARIADIPFRKIHKRKRAGWSDKEAIFGKL